MGWIKASDRLPLHKAHWNTEKYGTHDNDFPVRMNGRYAMANIYDESEVTDPQPKYMLSFEGKEHYENDFSEIEWLYEPEDDILESAIQLIKDIRHGNVYNDIPSVCEKWLIEHGIGKL